MLQTLKDFLFSPWQSIVLTVGGVTLALLFLSIFVLMLLRPQKKEAEDCYHEAFCWTCIALMSVFILEFALILSFVVEAKLGWQLSLLAGASVVIGAISLGAGFVISFSKIPMKYTFLWGTTGMASFVSILILSTHALPP